MPPLDKFIIAPINTGLQTDVRPWLIPDDAFAELSNAYVFRGRVRKRFGAKPMNTSVNFDLQQLSTRLRVNIGTTDGLGDFTVNVHVFTGNAALPAEIGQLFSVDGPASNDNIFTINALGAPAAMLTNGPGTGTFDTGTSVVTILGSWPLAPVYFYPAQPVMGFAIYEIAPINDEPTFAFDTEFAYQFVGGAWDRLGTAFWTGNNSQFFWSTTWRGAAASDDILFVTNYNTADQIKYWNGAAWTNFNPAYNLVGGTIETARIIVGFKDRLVLLNTVETPGPTTFPNRCRYSQNGSPFAADAFHEQTVTPGKGGFIDCPTQEAIVSAEFLKDRLIVFFERSTWELAYTGNQIQPFVWQQINTELGAESTFSIVPFDKVVLGVGNTGIHACNGSNVERIDEKIPDTVFEIHNDNEGVFRVAGIRDYFTELVYWTFPDQDNNATFPTRVLVYNYRTGSWAFNDDSITAFGYFQNVTDITWASSTQQWQQAIEVWGTGAQQSKFRQIIAGNQEGFTFIVDPDSSRNSQSLQVTDMTFGATTITLVIINHNLTIDDFIIIESASGVANVNDIIYQVNSVIDANTITVIFDPLVPPSGTYEGGGTVTRVSQISILTKQYNFYVKEARNAFIQKVDFLVDKTVHGEVTIDYFASTSDDSMLTFGTASGALIGTGTLDLTPYALYPLENSSSRLWHPVYLQTDGECIQLQIYVNNTQMLDTNIAWSDFEMHSMIFHARPAGYNLQ